MDKNMEIFTSEIELVETSDSSLKQPERAIIKIPIINFGSNSKHLNWTEATMEKVAKKFRGVPFRYDLTGTNEGSHTREHISSPFYDVGWTYDNEKGAYYDKDKKCVYVQGEVTHPDVIKKLMRKTSEGKREINYASMGAIMTPDQTKCSICDKSPYGSCNHVRGKQYAGKKGMEFAAMVPLDISKALHVALTNDPADKIAEIEQAIFQDMVVKEELADAGARSEVAAPVLNLPRGQEVDEIVSLVLGKLQEMEDSKMKKAKLDKKESVKDAVEVTQDDDIKLDKPTKGRKKKDKDFDEESLEEGTEKEGEHTKDKQEAENIAKDHLVEDKKYYKKLDKMESADDDEDEDDSEDVKKAKKASKGQYKDSKPVKDKELPKMKEMADDSEFKISGAVNTKPVIETQDSAIHIGKVEKNEIVETADNVYEEKYRNMLVKELADTYVKLGKAADKTKATEDLTSKSTKELEIFQDAFDGLMVTKSEAPKTSKSIAPKYKDIVKKSDNNTSDIVPQYGGTATGQTYAFQDMSPRDRTEKFGGYGSFDMCFHPENAKKYLNKRNK